MIISKNEIYFWAGKIVIIDLVKIYPKEDLLEIIFSRENETFILKETPEYFLRLFKNKIFKIGELEG